MNISEQADKYAQGKANEAITKAIAEAYVEGYKAGYKDCEEEIPMELRDNKTQYVDLGLPSGTLWSTDYEKLDGKILYLPYQKANLMKLPTKEQWEELVSLCKWEYDLNYCGTTNGVDCYDFCRCRCVGPSGNILTFEKTGHKITSGVTNFKEVFFWIEDNSDCNDKDAAHMHNGMYKTKKGISGISKIFVGYQLPVRLVR